MSASATTYCSTRGEAPVVDFASALLAGLAPDGGLYVPDRLPTFSLATMRSAGSVSYPMVATNVMMPFMDGWLDGETFQQMIEDAYRQFGDPDVCPLRQLNDGTNILELWHGPTLAFKDVALQLVGRLFDYELQRRGRLATVLVATSGDTGSAAIEACRGRSAISIVVLQPKGRVTEIQRWQMTTVAEPNVRNVIVDGSFDDCQEMVKAVFADVALRDKLQLSAMNSINWARVMAQMVYYVSATAEADEGDGVVFSVPSGNFGNALAGWYVKQTGLPIRGLIIASNRNDILTRWVNSGSLTAAKAVPTLSPSMDIQVSSNHERLLFELLGRSGAATAAAMEQFRSTGSVATPRDTVFTAARLDDDETLAEIRRIYETTGYLADPHTAIGIGAARRLPRTDGLPVVCLSTAHPAKFPDAVEQATGVRPELPERLAGLHELPEHFDEIDGDERSLKRYLLGTLV